MRRRLFLVLALISVLIPAAMAAPVSIDFWYGMTGPDGAYIKNIVEAFTKANPDVAVTPTAYAWATLWTKLDAAYAAGNPPQVVAFHIQEVAPYNSKGMLEPIGSKLAALGFKKDIYLPSMVESGQIGGEQYSLPIDVHPIAMYYNTDMFKAAGLNPNMPPKTYADLVKYAQKLTKSDKSQYGVGLEQKNDIQFYGFMSFFYQWGGKLVSDDNKKAMFDGEPARKALGQLHDLIWKYKVTPLGEEDARGDFRNRTNAIVFSGPWDNALEGGFPSVQGLHYRTAPVPLFGTTPATWKSSHQVAVIKQRDQSKVAPAVRLVKFASENSIIWNQSGMVPVLKAAATDPRLAPLKEYSKGFMESLPFAKFMPLLPKGWEELFEASPDRPIMKAIQSYLMVENPDANAILKEANDSLNRILARYYK